MATSKLVTIEDVEHVDDDLGRYDLIRGELVLSPFAVARSGLIAANIVMHLGNFIEENKLGYAVVGVGFVLSRDPDTLLTPDLAFVTADRRPPRDEQDGFPELAPDLAIEIVAPTDLHDFVHAKVVEFLRAGVKLVWIVQPESRDVTVYTPDRIARIRSGEDALDGGDVLPGLRLPLADIFR